MTDKMLLPSLPVGTTARVGHSISKNIYLQLPGEEKARDIGRIDNASYAALVVEALNFYLERMEPTVASGVH